MCYGTAPVNTTPALSFRHPLTTQPQSVPQIYPNTIAWPAAALSQPTVAQQQVLPVHLAGSAVLPELIVPVPGKELLQNPHPPVHETVDNTATIKEQLSGTGITPVTQVTPQNLQFPESQEQLDLQQQPQLHQPHQPQLQLQEQEQIPVSESE